MAEIDERAAKVTMTSREAFRLGFWATCGAITAVVVVGAALLLFAVLFVADLANATTLG